MIAAGPWAHSWYIKAIKRVEEVGAVTTKSYTFAPREGNKGVVGYALPHDSYLNRVGLKNDGVEKALTELEALKELGPKVFLSVADDDSQEALKLIKATEDVADGFELNISCPNAGGVKFSMDLSRHLMTVREATQKPITIKLPNLFSAAGRNIVVISNHMGADGLVASNTMPIQMLLPHGDGVVQGGLSSPALMYANGYNISYYKGLTDLPVIACGGVTKKSDVDYYLDDAGADFVQVGSCLHKTRSALLDILP